MSTNTTPPRGPQRYIFLDTEFTSLNRPMLLSIAMVEDPQTWFYGEVDLTAAPKSLVRRTNQFARTHVITQFGLLPDCTAPLEVVALRACNWLNARHAENLFIAYDYSDDYNLLERLLLTSSQPVAPALAPTHVAYLADDADGAQAAALSYADSVRLGLHKHHALADAFALHARFKAVHG